MKTILQMKSQMDQMAGVIQQLTGQNMGIQPGSSPASSSNGGSGSSGGSMNVVRTGEAAPSYAQKIAAAAPANIHNTGRVMNNG
jgi:hypothetical protein